MPLICRAHRFRPAELERHGNVRSRSAVKARKTARWAALAGMEPVPVLGHDDFALRNNRPIATSLAGAPLPEPDWSTHWSDLSPPCGTGPRAGSPGRRRTRSVVV